MIGRALALTHTGFSGLLGDRLVGENPNPQLAAALDETRDRDARRFNLAVGDPKRFHGFQTIDAECQRRTTPRLPGAASALLLAILHFLGHQHTISPLRYCCCAAGTPCELRAPNAGFWPFASKISPL